jgi:hypothetical protein
MLGALDQTSVHGILMNVMDTLHEDGFGCEQHYIGIVFPERILLVIAPLLNPKFVQRSLKTAIRQVLNDSARGDSLNEAQRVGWPTGAIRNNVQMIGHDHISEDQKATRLARLVQRRTEDRLESVRAKYRKAILGNGSDRKTR